MALRKLQAEIDKTLKAVATGVETFEQTFDKLNHATNTTQKDKLETDLKSQIKKLQRMRDQIKGWLGSSDIKDKSSLIDNRKLIETQMERFKALEKEMKMKAFSKEGLIAQSKLDPAEKAKRDIVDWIGTTTEELSRQIEATEAEAETLNAGKKKKTTGDRLGELETLNERRQWHIGRLEVVQRMVENGQLSVDQVEGIQEDVKYFVETNTEEDFEEDEGIYDDLNLIEDDELLPDVSHQDETSNLDSASAADTSEPPPTLPTVPTVPTVPKTPAKEPSISGDKETPAGMPKKTPASGTKPIITSTTKSTPGTVPPPVNDEPPSPVAGKKALSRKSTGDNRPLVMDTKIPPVPSTPSASTPAKPKPLEGKTDSPATPAQPPLSAAKPPPIRYAAAAAAGVAGVGLGAAASAALGQTSTAVPSQPVPAPEPQEIPKEELRTSPTSIDDALQANGHPRSTVPPPPPPGLSRSPVPPVPAPATANATSPQSVNSPLSINPSYPQPPQPSAQQPPTNGPASGLSSVLSPISAPSGSQPSSAVPPGPPGLIQVQPRSASTVQEHSRSGSTVQDQSAQGTDIRERVDGRDAREAQGVLGNLMHSFDMAKELSERRMGDLHELNGALDNSYSNAPVQADSEPPRYYHPPNPIKTPSYYPQHRHPSLEDKRIYSQMDVDQLFYIFYYMVGTYEQNLAANALKSQAWRFHKQYLTWFMRAHKPQAVTDDYEQGGYFYFDWENSWCQRKKSDFRFEYRWLSEH